MAFYGAQYQSLTPDTIPHKTTTTVDSIGAIIFDKSLVSPSEISHTSGVFTISAPGNYYIFWSVTVKTGLDLNGPHVSLLVKYPNIPEPLKFASGNDMKTGHFSGSAIIQVTEKITLGLYNTGEEEFTFSKSTNIKANITFVPYVTSTSPSSFGLVGCVLTLDSASITSVNYDEAVKFNTNTVLDDNYFEYDAPSGIIHFKKSGTFLLDWSINLDGSTDASSIKFALVEGTLSPTPIFEFESTLLLQQTYTGFYYLTTTKSLYLSLVNKTGDDTTAPNQLIYSNLTKKAIMRIISHT